MSNKQSKEIMNRTAVKPSKEIIQAAKNVLKARALVESLRPKIQAIQTELLTKLDARDEDGEPVTLSNKYCMTDAYADQYYPMLNAAYRAAGFDLEPDFCPLLMAENEVITLTAVMNKLAETLVTGFQVDSSKLYGEARKKLTDLNLQYISQFF
jgi:hypothetical protein